MRALSISSADAFILVYDVTDATTFEEVRMIRDQIHETKATSAVPIVVVGNKIDLLAEDSDLREVSVTKQCQWLKIIKPKRIYCTYRDRKNVINLRKL